MKKFCQKIWTWLGTETNHNAITTILAILAVIFAFPFFTKQINNIQVKVDSLSDNIQQLYGRYVTETFCNELQNSLTVENGQNVATIKLKYTPIPNSVSIWEGALNESPGNYTVNGNVVKLQTIASSSTLTSLCNDGTGFNWTITYVKAFQ